MNTRIEPHMTAAEVKRRATESKAGTVIRLWELDGTHADSLTLLNLFTTFPDHYDSEVATIMIDGTRFAVTSIDEDDMKVAVLVNMTETDVANKPEEQAANQYQKKTLEEYKAWWLEGLERDGIELVVPENYIKTIDSDAALKGDVAPPPMVDAEK